MPLHEGRVVCDACGQLDLPLTQHLQEANEKIAVLERELGRRLVDKSRLQAEAVAKLTSDKRYPDAVEVLIHWQKVCMPTAREPTNEARLRAVIGRLSGRDKTELMRCADGYARFPYTAQYGRRMTHGTPDQKKVDAEFIYRDDKHVLVGLELADRAAEQEEAFSAQPAVRSLGSLGDAAVRLATMGWHVFPCVAGEKRPATRRGFLDAKSDLTAVTRAWSQHPDLNLAVRTGKETGIVVLDVDGDEGAESLRQLERKYDDLPTTTSVKTPRGGSHFYFQHPGGEVRNTAGVPGPGLDVRGDGGYVLAPPSMVNGKAYEPDERAPLAPMPAWLLKSIAEYQAMVASKIQKGDWADLMLKATGQGQRNDMLARIAGHLITRLPADEVLATLMNANTANFKPPLSAREVEAVVSSIAKSEARKLTRG